MDKYATKLMNIAGERRSNTGQPSAIFGTAGTLRSNIDTRPPVRIGIWPLLSNDDPETTMGFMTALALFVDRWRSVRTYTLFVQLEGEPDDFQWDMSKSQFEVEDWQLDNLDDNVGLWGKLDRVESKWVLSLEIENDMNDNEGVIDKLEYTSEDIASLTMQIPSIGRAIIDLLDVSDNVLDISFDSKPDEESLKRYLRTLFEWERYLILSLWGKAWSEDDVEQLHDTLVARASQVTGDFGAWSITALTARAMQAGYGNVADILLKRASLLINKFNHYDLTSTTLAAALYRRGYIEQGLKLLEAAIKDRQDNPASWLTLAELYRQSGRMSQALDTYQSAIEQNATNYLLFVNYANLLVNMEYDGWEIEDFVLCDPDKIRANHIKWETIEAYEKALEEDDKRTDVMEQQIIRLVAVGAKARLWHRFKQLVAIDKVNNNILTTVDAFYEIDDAEPAVDILKHQYETEPDRHHLLLSLASVHLINDDPDQAIDVLEKAEEHLDDPTSTAQINRLMLMAEDPEFEMKLAEMRGVADAGNPLSSDDVDYLEEILERAPDFAEVYIILAKAYLAWDEDEDALDTLLDGYEEVPEDPDLIALLAEVLWDAGQGDLALKYLSENVKINPNSVEILTSLGRYTFESGDEDLARAYLQRAEAIGPRHPAFQKARVEITRMIKERDERD